MRITAYHIKMRFTVKHIFNQDLFGFEKGVNRLTKERSSVTTQERKIGKVTYIIQSSTNESKKDSLTQKINKCVKRDVEKSD